MSPQGFDRHQMQREQHCIIMCGSISAQRWALKTSGLRGTPALLPRDPRGTECLLLICGPREDERLSCYTVEFHLTD